MSCYLIKTEGGIKTATPVYEKEKYLQLRNSPRQKSLVDKARNGDKKSKMRLAQFNYSGLFLDGKVRGSRIYSNAFVFDCDDPNEFNRISEILKQNPEKYGLLMLERSVSQGGHIVCKRPNSKTILECQVWLATELRTEMDCSAHDINRVLFATTGNETDLLFLSDELFLCPDIDTAISESEFLEKKISSGEEDIPNNAHKANKHYRPWDKDENEEDNEISENVEKKTSKIGNTLCYDDIPYNKIISTWWEMYNDGKEPTTSNRDVLTFELAVNLRHICGFNEELMDKVIPAYDGFPADQKLKCIRSAINERRTQMPKRLRDVISKVKTDLFEDDKGMAGLEAIEQEDANFYYNQLPKMPMGISDSIASVGPSLVMPVIVTVCPIIGMLATNIRFDIHGRMNTLNLISFVAGEFASGKGNLDPLVSAWTEELQNEDRTYLLAEEEWRKKKRAAKNKKEQPEEPKYPIRILTLNNTVANLAERLANTEGKTAFSFTPEADTMAQKMKSSMTDYSVMLRQAYDASPYSREARSIDAVNVHIDHLRWNVVMVGTPDALFRILCNNYSDGFQSRIAVALTPDNTFSPLEENAYQLTPVLSMRIKQVAHLLPLLHGDLILSKVEKAGRKWLEDIRIESMKDYDRVKARQRFRVCVTAQRMICCMVLCRVCEKLIDKYGLAGAEAELKKDPYLWQDFAQNSQGKDILSAYPIIANALLDTNLSFFRHKIEAESSEFNKSIGGRVRSSKNDSIYERLDATFTVPQAEQQAIICKGKISRNSVFQMIKNWKKQGLIECVKPGVYRKIDNR